MSITTLKDNRIVIIGGSSGIGFATAKQAIEQGAHVIIAGRSKEKLKIAKKLINSNRLQTYVLDNQNKEQLQNFSRQLGTLIIYSHREPLTHLDQLPLQRKLLKVASSESFGLNIMP